MAQTLTALSTVSLRQPREIGLFDMLRTWRRRMTEKRQLLQFDARELHDVGLTGADRAAIVATPFWREADRRR